MLTIRPACWPDDIPLLEGLDTSFTTDRIYRVIRDELGFQLAEETVDPPFHKDYGPIADQLEEIRAMDCALIAQNDGGVVGFAAATYEAWNHRVNLWHLYVAPGHRRTGVATALIHHVEAFARSVGARCLRPETQNTNYPAIRFYRRMGFRLCGLDESLYDPEETVRDEIALFLVREVV